jgi:hypothetical protein
LPTRIYIVQEAGFMDEQATRVVLSDCPRAELESSECKVIGSISVSDSDKDLLLLATKIPVIQEMFERIVRKIWYESQRQRT